MENQILPEFGLPERLFFSGEARLASDRLLFGELRPGVKLCSGEATLASDRLLFGELRPVVKLCRKY